MPLCDQFLIEMIAVFKIKTLGGNVPRERYMGHFLLGIHVPSASKNHYLIKVHSLLYYVAYYGPHLNHFWANHFLTLKVLKSANLVTLLKIPKKAILLWSVHAVVKLRPHLAAHHQ